MIEQSEILEEKNPVFIRNCYKYFPHSMRESSIFCCEIRTLP